MIAIATTVILRVLGHEAWRCALVTALVLLAGRLVHMAVDAARGNVPWTRLLLPSIVWIEAVGLSDRLAWELRLATVGVLELAFVVVAIRALRSGGMDVPEVRIARALTALVPPAFARLAAVEMVLAGLAASFVLGGWRRATPSGFSYHRASGFVTLLAMLPLIAVGDVLLLELVVLPHASLWIRIAVHALAAYALIWLIGVYASMRARPHRLVDDRLELHRGALRELVIDVAQIASIAPLPSFADDWKKRAYLKHTVRLDVGDAPVLELTLHDGRRVLVAVDDAEAFTAAVERARRAAPSATAAP